MSLILNIDTATEEAGVYLAQEGIVLAAAFNAKQMDHASWVHGAIRDVLSQNCKKINEINAVAVTSGPGSYTGLRVALATAKGLCYAMDKPLIALNTLEVMTASVLSQISRNGIDHSRKYFCPMIDARRMEVFIAMFTGEMKEIWAPRPMILNENSFDSINASQEILLFGSGAAKWKQLRTDDKFQYYEEKFTNEKMCSLSYKKYLAKDFADLAYADPVYLKEFYTHQKN